MNIQVTLADLIKALEAEIQEDRATLKGKEPDVFLQAKIDQLAEYVAKAATEKARKPTEVRMTKRSREGAPRAVPLKALADPTKTEELPVSEEPIVAPPASDEEFVLPAPYEGERYLNYKHPETGRISGKGLTWDEAKELHARRLLRYRNPKKTE